MDNRRMDESQTGNVPKGSSKSSWRRRWTIVAILLLAAWAFHARLLRGFAEGLIVDDRNEPASAVLILDGDRQFDSAAQLYRAGAKTVLVYRCRPDRLVRMGILLPGDELARRELLKRGVSNQDFEVLDCESSCRSRIAAALGQWLAEHPDQTVNVLCERFTSRTWQTVLRRAAEPALAGQVRIVALPNRQFDESNWWQSKPGTMAFLNNYISLGFFWWHTGPEVDGKERTRADFRGAFGGDPG